MSMDRQAFLEAAGLEVATLEVWLEQRWLLPAETPEGAVFSEREVARASLIRDLSGDLGVNDPGIDVILHLTDQLHGLRAALARIRAEMVGG